MTQCTDCKLREAKVVPKLYVPAIGYPIEERRCIQAIMNAPKCAECFAKYSWANFDNDVIRRLMESLARSKGPLAAPPDFARAFVKGLPLDSVEYAQYEKVFAGGRPQ